MLYIFLLVLCGLPFAPLVVRNTDIWHAQGFWFQSGLLLLFCSSFYFEPKEIKVRNIPLGLLVLCIGGYTLFVSYKGLSNGKYLTANILPFFNFVCILVFYKLAVQYLNKDRIKIILRYLSYVLIITLFYCVFQSFGFDQFFKQVEIKKAWYFNSFNHPAVTGFIGNPTHLSAYLGMCLPLLFSFKRKTTKVLSITLLFVIILFYTNWGSNTVPVTGIVVAIATLLYYCLRTCKVKFIIALTVCIISIRLLLDRIDINYIKGLLNSQSRLNIWAYYLENIKDNFVTGRGLGVVNILARKSNWQDFRFLHNEYLHFLIETGILGLSAIFYCIYDFFTVKVKPSKEKVILEALFLGFLIQSATLYPAHLWLMGSVGLIAYAGKYALKNEELLCKPLEKLEIT